MDVSSITHLSHWSCWTAMISVLVTKNLFRKSVSLTVIVTTTHKPITTYPFFAFTESFIELDVALFLISHLIKLMQVKYFHIFLYFLQLVFSKVMARAVVLL